MNLLNEPSLPEKYLTMDNIPGQHAEKETDIFPAVADKKPSHHFCALLKL